MKKLTYTIACSLSLIISACSERHSNKDTQLEIVSNDSLHRIAGTKDGLQPEFPGGLLAANKYLNDRFVYPDALRRIRLSNGSNVTGKVWVKFLVDEHGDIKNVETSPEVSYSVTEEAERILKDMPKWRPATLGGKPVSYHTALRLVLDPNKGAPTAIEVTQAPGDIKVSPEEKIADEQAEASKQPYAKVSVAEYQQQIAKEKAEGYTDDAVLSITRRQLGDRVVWREQFINKYPMSPVSSKVNDEILSMMDVLVFSSTLDNDPTYEQSGQRLMIGGVKKGFEELIKAYPESQYMQILKKYLEMAKANGFRYNRDRDFDFRNKYGLPAMN